MSREAGDLEVTMEVAGDVLEISDIVAEMDGPGRDGADASDDRGDNREDGRGEDLIDRQSATLLRRRQAQECRQQRCCADR